MTPFGRVALGLLAGGALQTSSPEGEPPLALRVHEVRPGESLWAIAADQIGDPTLWPLLYRANRDQIKDPSVVYPGQKLTIPPIDPASREAVRREAGALGVK